MPDLTREPKLRLDLSNPKLVISPPHSSLALNDAAGRFEQIRTIELFEPNEYSNLFKWLNRNNNERHPITGEWLEESMFHTETYESTHHSHKRAEGNPHGHEPFQIDFWNNQLIIASNVMIESVLVVLNENYIKSAKP